MYITYKFYDQKKRRLSIFGKQIDSENIEITTIPCNKKDRFCKKVSMDLLTEADAFKTVNTIKGSNLEDFLRHLRKTYVRKKEVKIEISGMKNPKVIKTKGKNFIVTGYY